MRQSQFSETQIVGILKEAEAGVAVNDLLRTHGISRATFFTWRSKYGGTSISDMTRLREFDAENAKLKRMYAPLGVSSKMRSQSSALKTSSCSSRIWLSVEARALAGR